ncbi:hypothetical protein B0H34DRAFT_703569 [Crassisporium funariophilum]|nr:hypothetical protein B0H34DRAFT_703569 [Crassisporium funariophilum]
MPRRAHLSFDMSMMSRLSFLLIVLACIGCVVASPVQETNAQRLARGLPPNPPKFLRDFLRAVGVRSPTPVASSKRTLTSPVPPTEEPPVTLTGRLEIRSKVDGGRLGRIRNWPGGGTIGGTNFLGPDGDLLVTLTYTPSSTKKFDILSTNPAFPAPFYVGAGSFSTLSVPTINVGSRNTIAFTNVESTPPDSTPVKPPTRDAYVESAIWSIDPTTQKLSAQWINADGSKPLTILAYNIRSNALFFVGDIDAHNMNNNTPASAVVSMNQ